MVIIILGILAAIAIPLFMNQQKSAMRSTLESDVRNSVATVLDATKGRPSFENAPTTFTPGIGSQVIAGDHPEVAGAFMIYGFSVDAGDYAYCYDSSKGKADESYCPESGTPAEEAAEADAENGNEACFSADGTDSAYLAGFDGGFWYADWDDFYADRAGYWDSTWGGGCVGEWQRGYNDQISGNEYSPFGE
ncbi:hypothetical protein [Demequina sediminis]|uniref:hypothetical protein n=1 Tax=Demequina sediminis TaxID=1930058 RepID=UPI002572FE8D|nr:hypothetical protein [Demequina sediminis]